jgi:acyl-coenzyme A thioesterase PaaI-like protein
LRKTYGSQAEDGAKLDVRFVRPVRENDILVARGRMRDGAIGIYDVAVENQLGEPVISGILTLAA